MKFGLKLENIQVGEKATIGGIEINVQYTAEELVQEFGLVKKIIKEIPEIVADLGAGAIAFDKMDKAFDGLSTARNAEDSTEESKQSAINKVMEVVNSIRNIVPSSSEVEEKEVV